MNTYILELAHEVITPVTVKAGSPQEAEDKAQLNQGNAGDSYSGGTRVISIRCTDD